MAKVRVGIVHDRDGAAGRNLPKCLGLKPQTLYCQERLRPDLLDGLEDGCIEGADAQRPHKPSRELYRSRTSVHEEGARLDLAYVPAESTKAVRQSAAG